MSDLYDANQSRLRVAHRHLFENDRLYRISLVAAPIALVVAVTAGTLSIVWHPAPPLPPPAVPVPLPAPAPPAQQAADLPGLRDRAESDAAALGELTKRANSGSAAAQFYLATLYDPTLPGVRFAKDGVVAAQWYERAAEQSYGLAENNLGYLYEDGQGKPKDTAQAANWYRKAADQGVSLAQFNLGRLYATGEGVPRDLGQALVLFRRAASQGSLGAAYDLAYSLDKGFGVPRNPMAAYIWYSIVARLSSPDKQSQAAAERDRIGREATSDDLAAAQRAAANWRVGSHGRIGVAIQDLTPAEAQSIGSGQTKGVVVTKVEDGSPAQRAGLAAQDVVTAIDGEAIANSAAFHELVWLDVPGQIVALWVEKSRQRGSLQTVHVELDQAPP